MARPRPKRTREQNHAVYERRNARAKARLGLGLSYGQTRRLVAKAKQRQQAELPATGQLSFDDITAINAPINIDQVVADERWEQMKRDAISIGELYDDDDIDWEAFRESYKKR